MSVELLMGYPGVSDKTRCPIPQLGTCPAGLIIAEVSDVFKMFPAVCNAGSPGEGPFAEAVAPRLLFFRVCIGKLCCESEVLF